MKKLFDRWVSPGARPPGAGNAPDDAGFFATAFMERDESPSLLAASTARSRIVSAEPCGREHGLRLLREVWSDDPFIRQLAPAEFDQLADFLDFIVVPAGREVIAQDEPGDFALVVLDGLLGVERVQPWGGRARLGEARCGEVVGELALLDAGLRFSSCTALAPCTMAVINARQLERLMQASPRLGMALMAAVARRLSLRMRQVSARLSALLSAT